MDRKMERLVLILEGVALITALILILVDYKLKNDLTDLYQKMEVALARGQKLFDQDGNSGSDPVLLRPGDLVGNVSPLETTDHIGVAGQNGKPKARRSPTAGRSRGNGDKAVSESDKPMGT
jgi:hypothetical protein